MTRADGPWRRAITRLRNAARPNVVVEAPPDDVVVEQDVEVPTRDGVLLRVNVYAPPGNGAYPVLISAHPYGKDHLPSPRRRGGFRPHPMLRVMPQSQRFRISAWTGWEAPDPACWVPRGYVVVNADLRGFGRSDGVGELMSAQEGDDVHDLIEWAAAQPWSTGRIGLSGVSYLAMSQWAAAATRPPHLAAICPWEGLTDLYRDVARPGGVREDGFLVVWTRATQRAAPRSPIDLRRQQKARPLFDEWWAARNRDIENIDVPALVCGSFSDHNLHTRGSFEGYRRISSQQKWLYTHRGPKWAVYYSGDALEAQFRFFDHFLKGEDNGQDREPPVRLEVRADADTITSIRYEQQWPPAATAWQRWHLDPNGNVLVDTAADIAGTATFHTRRGGLVFTRRFGRDTEIVGPMVLRLAVELHDAHDVSLFAGIRKLHEGRPVPFEGSFGFRGPLVTHGMRKASQRQVDETRSLPWLPVHTEDSFEPLRPGQIVPVDIALPPSATLFRAGDELQLEVRGRWFYVRNPLTGQFPAYYRKSPRGTCVLHFAPGYPSHLDVPVQGSGGS